MRSALLVSSVVVVVVVVVSLGGGGLGAGLSLSLSLSLSRRGRRLGDARGTMPVVAVSHAGRGRGRGGYGVDGACSRGGSGMAVPLDRSSQHIKSCSSGGSVSRKTCSGTASRTVITMGLAGSGACGRRRQRLGTRRITGSLGDCKTSLAEKTHREQGLELHVGCRGCCCRFGLDNTARQARQDERKTW